MAHQIQNNNPAPLDPGDNPAPPIHLAPVFALTPAQANSNNILDMNDKKYIKTFEAGRKELDSKFDGTSSQGI